MRHNATRGYHSGNVEKSAPRLTWQAGRATGKEIRMMNIEGWTIEGERLAREHHAATWAIGDWLIQGEAIGAGYEQAEEVTGLDYQTLRNVRYVAGCFDVSRRRDKLSFAHHATVAALPAEEADRLLLEAERESWSVKRLRLERSLEKLKPMPSEEALSNLYRALCDADERIPYADAEELQEIIKFCDKAEEIGSNARLTAEHNYNVLLKYLALQAAA
jgi:hypothetical protein